MLYISGKNLIIEIIIKKSRRYGGKGIGYLRDRYLLQSNKVLLLGGHINMVFKGFW